MLTAPASGQDGTMALQQQQQAAAAIARHTRRRPLSGDLVRGWADVRKLDDDGTRVAKYHVDLNLTAQLNWDEWQRMCDDEPSQLQEPTWCILAPHDASDSEDGDSIETRIQDREAQRSWLPQGASLDTFVGSDGHAQQRAHLSQSNRSDAIAMEMARLVRREPRPADEDADPTASVDLE